jgi:TetR/AcrR family transcriptional repressor of bet genes
MARKSIREIRRQELSDAAFEVLMQHGIRGTTVDRVAKVAGVSKGIVLHNFGGKDALFEAVLRKSNSLLRDGVVELFAHADTAEERLFAIIVGNFTPSIFKQEICHAWINLCADVPHNPQSLRIQTVVHARMRSNLLSALKPLVRAEEAEMIAMQITTLIDGLWLRASLQKEPMPSETGINQLEDAINLLLGNDANQRSRFHAAREKMENLANIILGSKSFQKRTAG